MERLAGKVMLLWGWRRAFAAFLAGAFLVLVQAPYDFFAAGFVSFPILVWLLDGATADRPHGFLRRLKPAFAVGYWFGLGYFLAGLWWIGAAFLVDAENYAWALPIGVLFLPALMSLFYAAATATARLFWSEGIGRIAMLAAAFGIGEWLRGVAFSGFPWNAVGYGAMPIPLLMQPVQLVGMVGMNVLAVFVFSLPALLSGRRHVRIGMVALIVLVGAQLGFGYYRLSSPAPEDSRQLDVRIIQTAVDQVTKWDDDTRAAVFKSLLDQSAAPSVDGKPRPTLVLWPETTVPYLLTREGTAIAAIGEALSEGQNLMAGVVRSEDADASDQKARYYNSAMMIDDEGVIVDAVDKVHLVPGGEYIPLEELFAAIGVDQLVAGPNNFAAGAARHPVDLDGIRMLPFICYEVIFGAEVYRDAANADLLVNLTNDGWFGDTPGPYQHLRQAQVRAVENGLPLLRAVNAGVSAAVDAKGRIIDALELNAAGPLDVTVSIPREKPARLVDAQLVGLLLAAAAALLGFVLSVSQRLRAN